MIYPLEQIRDNNQILNLRKQIEGLFGEPGYINKQWLAQKEWIAVPVEDEPHPTYLRSIKVALGKIDCKKVYALLVGPLLEGNDPERGFSECLKANTSKEGLGEMFKEINVAPYVVFSENLSFMIFSSDAEFSVICGTKSFVEDAVGHSITQQRQRFVEYALSKTWSDKEKQFYLDLEKYYR